MKKFDDPSIKKKCTGRCSRDLPATPDFFSRMKYTLRGQCKDCDRAERKEKYNNNPSAVIGRNIVWQKANRNYVLKYHKQYGKRYHQKLKVEVILHYGGRCACPGCGESRIEFLTIDHINNDGAEHRRFIGKKSGSSTYRWLKKSQFPDGFQVLCFNCNFAKWAYGVCPHQQERKK